MVILNKKLQSLPHPDPVFKFCKRTLGTFVSGPWAPSPSTHPFRKWAFPTSQWPSWDFSLRAAKNPGQRSSSPYRWVTEPEHSSNLLQDPSQLRVNHTVVSGTRVEVQTQSDYPQKAAFIIWKTVKLLFNKHHLKIFIINICHLPKQCPLTYLLTQYIPKCLWTERNKNGTKFACPKGSGGVFLKFPYYSTPNHTSLFRHRSSTKHAVLFPATWPQSWPD